MSARGSDTPSVQQLAILRRVRDRIDREFDQPLNVQELAAGVHMSAGHLSRGFKAAYGESPYSYLMTRRIERSMALIRRGDLSITDICFAVGFSSLGTFSTRFSELVGVSPSRYRSGVVEGDHDLPTIIVKNVLRPVRNREVPPR
ncbi:MAG: helix-turn-helix transcriptional regulator [Brevibacterium aurantiacum]|uniref:AraC family transcriptional regulator n=1 Tax=Brevibacterium aurantiacum TaxID=273384 RepID=A0A2A3YWI7_BREAU|nr:helix-turn-helix transcriptional regulator [Brevibacterium aurantiacum]MDN5606581.1 helix-turn-helix transcriptional regulator [Brevibacterium sp.]AZL09450.1 AraC family transcriptional regulator [Brevibacterium aurantiacum]AZT93573.1 AraC family transcriptional regulator [Brevibacterium aurantiacum]MDN5660061.1 helix-turn-helix transcriptional regulator [Brevibacterium aurantiacum]PCC43676.1 AraC family transcriptional regulator [Brevibacterium aurantiacum]